MACKPLAGLYIFKTTHFSDSHECITCHKPMTLRVVVVRSHCHCTIFPLS